MEGAQASKARRGNVKNWDRPVEPRETADSTDSAAEVGCQ